MPTELTPELQGLLLFTGLSMACLVGVGLFGFLGPKAFADAPKRKVVLGGIDVMLGAGLWLVGMGVGSVLVLTLKTQDAVQSAIQDGLPPAVANQLGEDSLWWGALALLVGMLPVVGYHLFRLWQTDGGLGKGLKQGGLVSHSPMDIAWWLGGAVVSIICLAATGSWIQQIMAWMGHKPPAVAHALLESLQEDKHQIWPIAVMAVLIAPLFEELFFRGFLQTAIRGAIGQFKGLPPVEAHTPGCRWMAIVVTGCVFGLIHAGSAELHALPMLMVFGVILGWLYERTGSLWPCIGVHAAFNLMNVMVIYNTGA